MTQTERYAHWQNSRAEILAEFMPHYVIKIEYDGTGYAGWQRQKEAPSIQGEIERALAKLEPDLPSIVAAGRTDAGVHALGQVASLETGRDWDPFRLSEALNYHLKPQPIAITACATTDAQFSARFSAISRTYHFRILSRRAPETHLKNQVWRVGHALDVPSMQEAANHLLGQHDFTTFRSVDCQAQSPVKTLDQLDIERRETLAGPEIHFTVKARSFLHNQVRSFVGTLERVGAGSWSSDDVRRALEAKDRAACGPVCPPQGLYLVHVDYPENPFDP